MNLQRATIAALAGILFFYFFLRPDVDLITLIMIGMIWVVSLAWDLRVTFSNESYILRYEQSFVLVFFHTRLARIPAVLLVILVESACVILLPVVFFYEINPGCSMVIAYFFAILHVMAVFQNEKFVKCLDYFI